MLRKRRSNWIVLSTLFVVALGSEACARKSRETSPLVPLVNAALAPKSDPKKQDGGSTVAANPTDSPDPSKPNEDKPVAKLSPAECQAQRDQANASIEENRKLQIAGSPTKDKQDSVAVLADQVKAALLADTRFTDRYKAFADYFASRGKGDSASSSSHLREDYAGIADALVDALKKAAKGPYPYANFCRRTINEPSVVTRKISVTCELTTGHGADAPSPSPAATVAANAPSTAAKASYRFDNGVQATFTDANMNGIIPSPADSNPTEDVTFVGGEDWGWIEVDYVAPGAIVARLIPRSSGSIELNKKKLWMGPFFQEVRRFDFSPNNYTNDSQVALLLRYSDAAKPLSGIKEFHLAASREAKFDRTDKLLAFVLSPECAEKKPGRARIQ